MFSWHMLIVCRDTAKGTPSLRGDWVWDASVWAKQDQRQRQAHMEEGIKNRYLVGDQARASGGYTVLQSNMCLDPSHGNTSTCG